MIVGQKYVSSEIDSVYDAIVIGSGLGGLTTAALMAKAGKKVLVLERHYTAGGFTHSFKRRGYEWDVGVHYVGEVHNPNSTLRRVFDVITDGNLQWAKMDAVYDKIIIQGEQFNFVAGAANFREELLRSFPTAGRQIDAYLHHIRAATLSLPAHFGPRFLPGALQPTVGSMVGRLSNKYFHRTTKAVMAEFITDPKLASVLTGQWGDYGLPPGQSSFAMHAVVAQHYLAGGNFPIGGASQIARHIEPVIQRAGGAVVVNAEVEQILVEQHGSGDRAIGVRMANGDEILCQQVVSAAGLYNTYGKLMPESVGARHRFSDKMTAFKPSVAHLGLYVGLKGSAADLKLEQANMWIYRDADHDASLSRFLAKPSMDFPLNYISFPSSKDPAWDEHYPGKSTIDVISLAPYEWFGQWANKPWKSRGADYDAFKAKLSEKLLSDVYKHVPSARGKVDYFELSTPLSTQHFNNYGKGQLYGMDHTPERFAQSWVKPRTPIKGLFLTGQDILFCGVASAMMSGVMTATSALGAAATKLMPELVTPKARWMTKLVDQLPIVGSSASAARAHDVKLADPDPVQRPFVARCVEVVDVTADVKALRFVDASGQVLQYKPGQFVTLALDMGGKSVFRSYTLSSTPTQTGYFEVTVKRVDGGLVSNGLCDQVAVGTTLNMTGPHGKFSCAPKPRKPLLMLSAGSGVTPMLSMSRWIRDRALDTDVIYFHCARTQADVMFAQEVSQMASGNPRFVQHISLTRASKSRRGLSGYLDAKMLKKIAPDFAQREVYVCGPTGFMEGTKAMFEGLIEASGFNMRHYHEESFATAGAVKASGGTIFFAKSGVKASCSGEQSILDIATQAGVKIANACRTGDCGECKVRKISGDTPMANTDGLAAHEIEDGDVLTCVGYVCGDVVITA